MQIRELNSNLSELSGQLKVMSGSPMEYEVSPSEIVRRQALIEALAKQLGALEMIGKSNTSGGGMSTMNPLQLNDSGLLQRQKDVIQMQDEMVGDLGRGVDRLHRQAVTIGDEAKQQTTLLNQIDQRVDDATTGLKEEASHAKIIAQKAASCYLYICVAIEVIVIVILLILMFVKH